MQINHLAQFPADHLVESAPARVGAKRSDGEPEGAAGSIDAASIAPDPGAPRSHYRRRHNEVFLILGAPCHGLHSARVLLFYESFIQRSPACFDPCRRPASVRCSTDVGGAASTIIRDLGSSC